MNDEQDSYPITAVRYRFGELVEQMMRTGRPIKLTRWGRTVAQLIPPNWGNPATCSTDDTVAPLPPDSRPV